jgi:ABC-type multidrug transport system fused ATPase/permease subunit
MYLIKTALRGTQFNIEFVDNQPNKPKAIDLSSTTFTGDSKILTKFPIGTVFIVSEILWGEVVSKIIGAPRPVIYEETVYGNTVGEISCTHEDVNYTFEWMLMSNEIKREKALEYAAKWVEMGYLLDVEAKCKAYAEDETGTLRDRIMRLYPCPDEQSTGFHIDADVWYLLIRNIMRGENTLLVGPTGSGKTELVSHIARAMEKPLSIQDMGTVQDAQSALLGVHRLNKDGHSEFDYAPFVGHVQQDGIVLLDELNR